MTAVVAQLQTIAAVAKALKMDSVTLWLQTIAAVAVERSLTAAETEVDSTAKQIAVAAEVVDASAEEGAAAGTSSEALEGEQQLQRRMMTEYYPNWGLP